MARSERTRSPRNGGASAGQRAVRSRPRSALRQDQPTPPDQAEFVLCEQTILARSRPIMLTLLIAGGSLMRTLSWPEPWHIDAVVGRPPHLLAFSERLLPEFAVGGERAGIAAQTQALARRPRLACAYRLRDAEGISRRRGWL